MKVAMLILGMGIHPVTSLRALDFVERANRLAQHGQIDAGLDIIYDQIDNLLKNGAFEKVNSLLKDLAIGSISTDILLGLLTATLPAKSKVPLRKEFFEAVESEIRRRREWEDGLLIGLEQ